MTCTRQGPNLQPCDPKFVERRYRGFAESSKETIELARTQGEAGAFGNRFEIRALIRADHPTESEAAGVVRLEFSS